MPSFLQKLTTKPQPSVVQGTPAEIIQYVLEDIQLVKNEIRKYNELTGVLQSNSMYLKLLKLLEQDHTQDVRQLKVKFSNDEKNDIYQRQLLAIHKKVLSDYSKLLDMLKNNYNHGLYAKHISKRKPAHRDTNGSLTAYSSNASTGYSCNTSAVSSLFLGSAESVQQITDEAPEEYLDPISFNLFNDPVVTPNGITYERAYLLEHLEKKGKFDPVTKQPLREHQLYPNLALKDAVENYIAAKKSQEC